MSDSDTSSSLPSMEPLRLVIRGLSHVPSFKNSKMLTRGRLIAKPENQQWMERATQLIASQLLSASLTTGEGTQMVRSLLSSTALCGRFDDSVQWMPEISIRVKRVKKGEEGAEIELERI